VLVVRVGGIQLCEAIGVRARGCNPLEDEADPGFTEVQAQLVVVVGIVGQVLPVEIRDVVALELDEPASLQSVEGADHARAAEIERAGALWLVLVLRMTRPAVVKGGFGLGDDLADRRLDRARVPGLLEERLVALGIEKRQR
jgi:hypothetical protein